MVQGESGGLAWWFRDDMPPDGPSRFCAAGCLWSMLALFLAAAAVALWWRFG